MEMTSFKAEKGLEDTINRLWKRELNVKKIKDKSLSTNKTDVKKDIFDIPSNKDVMYYTQKLKELNAKLKEAEKERERDMTRLKENNIKTLLELKKINTSKSKNKKKGILTISWSSSCMKAFIEKKYKTEYESNIYSLINKVLEDISDDGLLNYLYNYHKLWIVDKSHTDNIMDKLLDDREFMLTLIKINNDFIKFSSDRLNNDLGYIYKIIDINVWLIYLLPYEIQKNKSVLDYIINKFDDPLYYINSCIIKRNHYIASKALLKNMNNIKYFNDPEDRDVLGKVLESLNRE